MFRFSLIFILAQILLFSGNIDMGLEFDKDKTKVVFFGKRNLAMELKKDDKYSAIVQLTGSKLTRYRVCRRDGDNIICAKYSNGGKLVHRVDTFNIDNVSKVTGKYQQYYVAYIGNKNRYDCPFVVWDEYKYKFISEDKRDICKDEYRVKYIGTYKNGQKVGTWITKDKKGRVIKEKEYRYSKLRERY